MPIPMVYWCEPLTGLCVPMLDFDANLPPFITMLESALGFTQTYADVIVLAVAALSSSLRD